LTGWPEQKKQCIVFKVYGAGRRCASREDRLAALREVFAAARPSDCVVIGMFPKYSDSRPKTPSLSVKPSPPPPACERIGAEPEVKIPFNPSVYEHAARWAGCSPWEASRDPDRMFRGHRDAWLA
jgi:hypothetical protein